MTTLADKARKALECATPGPWVRDCWDILGNATRHEGGTGAVCEVGYPNRTDDKYWQPNEADSNARLIALTPDLARAYLDTLDENLKAAEAVTFHVKMTEKALNEMRDIMAERDRLREALSDIAYRSGAPDDLNWCQRKARAALIYSTQTEGM